MDPISLLVDGARSLMAAKCLMASTVALTLYDYLLVFGDEVRYVWKGRKTWASYLYILNRILLTGYQLWMIQTISSPRSSKTVCLTGYHFQVFSVTFFLFSSDIFVTLRIYAITSKNKLLTVYFGALALARMAVPFVSAIVEPPTITNLPPIPIDFFNLCAVKINLQLMVIPNSIGSVFEISAFLVIVWHTYRIRSSPELSDLIRAITTGATIYFLAMVALQAYVLASLIFMKGTVQQLSFLTYGCLNPILTMRFVVSLRRTADQRGRRRKSKSVSLVSFAGSPPDAQASATRENIEMDPVKPPNVRALVLEP